MAITKVKSSNIEDSLDLSGKTVTLPAASVTAHASPAPTLDSPVITGTLSVLDSSTVTHTIANWSDDITYTITPTNCTAGAVNASGQFVITHTSGTPSYTIKATTASLGLGDSALVTKNITMQLTAPTLSSPADVSTATNVVYTITSTSTGDDKIILDPGTANFTYQSVSVGTASKVGNTVECISFGTNNPAVTIQFTAEATYSVTAKSVNIAGTYGTSANSSADSITIANTVSVHFLVQAGGGASGKGGVEPGAGAGGLRTSWAGGSGGGGVSESQLTLIPTTVYTITVGAGGAGSSSAFNSGADSVISGTGLTTVTSLGGGYSCQHGSSAPDVGANGGCGGGGKNAGTYGSGTANQGYDGSVRISGNYPLGGGGGTDEAGGTDQAGDGGDGKQVNIDGNNYYWGGGGGSGGHSGHSGGVWGWGGDGGLGGGGGGSGDAMGTTFGAGGGSAINSGGTGVDGNHPGGAGGANSGGGAGGGSDSNSTSASGGSGCVILRMTTSSYSGTTSGSPTITTIGSDTILTFTGSGTYTA